MPTTNPRAHITLDKELAFLLANLAMSEKKSVSSVAKDLLREALERREDRALSLLAEEREEENQIFISHKDVWK